jgi:hypothetical protein
MSLWNNFYMVRHLMLNFVQFSILSYYIIIMFTLQDDIFREIFMICPKNAVKDA